MDLEQAIDVARRAHSTQTDKAGRRPYIEHVLRVIEAVDTEDQKLAAALHDVVEDTELTLEDLRAAGCPPKVLEAVDSLTRREGESYDDFIERVARDPLARVVKLADLADNSNEGRLALLEPEDAKKLRSKYARARELLLTTDEPETSSGGADPFVVDIANMTDEEIYELVERILDMQDERSTAIEAHRRNRS